jgi:NitT/TauT family transport system ATP-binding protein
MTQQVKIAVRSLTKKFKLPTGGDLTVLDGLSFDAEDGAFVSFLGPSGCGKSTLLNILGGLDRPTSGSITVDGKDLLERRSSIRIGFVFQQPRLLNWRTVKQNVLLPLEEMGLPGREREARALRYLELVGLTPFIDYYPLQISGGMQQRVAVARALVIEPDLLLADEPFSALDELTARKLRQEFLRIWQATGRTIVFVTHSIREAVFLSTRLVLVRPRPARIHLNLPIEAPYPRGYEDDRLFQIEKEVTRDFMRMEEESEGRAAVEAVA